MARRWELVEMPVGGVDQYTDAPHVAPGKMREMQNVRFYEPPKASKRQGYDNVGNVIMNGVTNVNTPTRIIPSKDETLLAGDNTLYAYTETLDKWDTKGSPSDAWVDVQPLLRPQQVNITAADSVTLNNFTFIFWRDNGVGVTQEVRCTIIDNRGGTVIYEDAVASSGTGIIHISCFKVGDYAYCAFSGATGLISYTRVDSTSTSPAPITAANITTTNTPTAAKGWDVAEMVGDTSTFLLAYGESGSGVNVDRINTSNSVTLNFKTLATLAGPIAVEGSLSEEVYLGFDNGTDLKGIAINPTTFAQIGSTITVAASVTTSKIGIGRRAADHRVFVWQVDESGTRRAYMQYQEVDNAPSNVGSQQTLRDVVPNSKPWNHDGRVYLICGYDDRILDDPLSTSPSIAADGSKQSTLFVAELTNDASSTQAARRVADIRQGQANPYTPTTGVHNYLLHVSSPSTSVYRCVSHYRYRILFAGENDSTIYQSLTGLDYVDIDLANDERYDHCDFGNLKVLAGGRPTCWDGRELVESSFAWFPENFENNTAGGISTGGGLEGTATPGDNKHTFCVVYEHRDSKGNIFRSAPSDLITYTLTHTTTTGRLLPKLMETLWTDRSSLSGFSVRAVPYRAVRNNSAGPFYRDSTRGFVASYSTTIEIGLEFDDDALVQQEQLYINGDILDNGPAPPCKFAEYHNDRVFLGGLEDANFIAFSQPYVDVEGPRFNEALRINIGEPVTGMQSMDGQLIVFTRYNTYVVIGNGPPATGGLDIGFDASLISTDTGCIDSRSIVLTPAGVMFQGEKGIYLLDRGLQVEFRGAPIQDTLDTFQEVTGAALHPTEPEVHFTVTRASAGRTLVYNYLLDQWTVDTYASATQKVASLAPVWSGVSSQRKLMRAFTDGTLGIEGSSSTWDDNGSHAPWQLVSNWLKINTMQGWQAVRKLLFLFERITSGSPDDFGLRFQFAYNYNSNSYTETHSFSIPAVTALIPEGQLEVHLARQECESVRVRITETASGENNNTPGPAARSLVWEIGMQGGRSFQLPDASRK